MIDFSWMQIILTGLIFVWSGFVRSGLGFGGALFTLPFLLLIHDDPLFFLPIISLHLLFFAGLTVVQAERKKGTSENSPTVNWAFVRYALLIMLMPKLAGVIGLLMLPTALMNIIIYLLIAGYSISYIIARPMQSNSRKVDVLLLVIAAYISGTSLIGGPLVIAVAMRHIKPHEFRNTLFVLWWILVSIKLTAFVIADVDIQLMNSLLLLPFAALGHLIGHKFHDQLLQRDSRHFYQLLGWVLLATSFIGMFQTVG